MTPFEATLIANEWQSSFATLGYLNLFVPIAAEIPVSVVSTVWLSRAAKEEGKSRWLWGVFGALFQAVAVAVFYATSAYQRTRQTR